MAITSIMIPQRFDALYGATIRTAERYVVVGTHHQCVLMRILTRLATRFA